MRPKFVHFNPVKRFFFFSFFRRTSSSSSSALSVWVGVRRTRYNNNLLFFELSWREHPFIVRRQNRRKKKLLRCAQIIFFFFRIANEKVFVQLPSGHGNCKIISIKNLKLQTKRDTKYRLTLLTCMMLIIMYAHILVRFSLNWSSSDSWKYKEKKNNNNITNRFLFKIRSNNKNVKKIKIKMKW